MKKILLSLFVGLLLLYSCSKDDNGTIPNEETPNDSCESEEASHNNGTVCDEDENDLPCGESFLCDATANYMEFFFKPRNLELEFHEFIVEGAVIDAKLFSSWCCEETEFFCDFHAYPDSVRLPYYDYVNYYGDTTYWQRHSITHNGVGCIMPLKSISVVADKDLDEAHPAGTPINDLLDIGYSRIYSYIKGGYTPEGANDGVLFAVSPLATFEGDFLFPEESRLIFKKKPAPGKYTFTVTFTFDKDPVSGDSLELAPASIEVEF